MLSPEAVTMMSAASSAPDSSRIPVSVKRTMRSVTTEAEPSAMALNRSESGTTHIRWSHGA